MLRVKPPLLNDFATPIHRPADSAPMKLSGLGMIRSQFLLLLMACSARVAICSFNENSTDRLSLLEFKNNISDPQQALVSWNDSAHFCSWEGVMCSAKHPNRVTSLRLPNKGLVGSISPFLGNLTFMKILTLSDNSFTGDIPPSLGHLHRLQQLILVNNTLQGSIPSLANCSKLEILALYSNQLTGQIPVDLPHGLRRLLIGSNNLTGSIPDYLANMTQLYSLAFESNNIMGSIPNELGKLSGLQELNIGGNKLFGLFPLCILNLSNLNIFNVAFNDLRGDLPHNFGNSLRNLELLELGDNLFRGQIPSSLTNTSKMSLCDLSRNMFTGVLYILNLEENKLHAIYKQDWEFMNSLTNCTELQVFSISGNNFEGSVPNSVGNLSSQLLKLYFSKNQLSGGFPSGIANLRKLINIALEVNKFTGAVPDWIGTLTNVQQVSLDNNFFTESIPSSFSNLSQLEQLYLQSNRFNGQIPLTLGNLQTLGVLNISNNNLHGNIPKELFRIPTLWMIDLVFQQPYLENIELGHNDFSGSIPASLGDITSLQNLNLSHNNLTGSIPVSLSKLQLLEKLDLSFNDLQGEVPTEGIFSNTTAILVEGNQELCGGPLELHLHACPVVPLDSSKHNLSFVLKVVIPVASVFSIFIAISVLLFQRRKHKTKSISLPSFGRKFPRISHSDIVRATGGFAAANLIGQGRYGSAYRGKLFPDGNIVAIKVFSLETRGAQKSFIAECNALRNVRHRNMVPILTAISTVDSNGNDFNALVYEFMPQGDLHNLLYSPRGSEDSPVSLAQRLSIVVNVSDALEYLHHGHQGTIVHCDLKPSNILLDDDMVAHVGDLGLARFKFDSTTSSDTHSNSTSSVAIKGTHWICCSRMCRGRSGFNIVRCIQLRGCSPRDIHQEEANGRNVQGWHEHCKVHRAQLP
ncbi:hypothetical protein BS78_K011200 [Paspalum vaginatum]|uniref:Protein kinase domain-containing protein n=1 Tax=Paspalum vaginatum TaxID=158149 RepID=A0A9W8CG84_9POAL|nr:hypothetical protein BS78_K011200 [Paspalum vaginatum]